MKVEAWCPIANVTARLIDTDELLGGRRNVEGEKDWRCITTEGCNHRFCTEGMYPAMKVILKGEASSPVVEDCTIVTNT